MLNHCVLFVGFSDSALRVNGVLDCKPSSSAFSRSSDGGVTKNDEDAPVPSPPKPPKGEDDRPQSSHDEKKATDEPKARTDREESKMRPDDDDDAASEKSQGERAQPIKHARKSSEVAPLLNDLTAGNCSWMCQASRSQQRQDKSAKKKAPRLAMEERKLKDIQINWVQCDEWYHNLRILGAEKAVEEDEFHRGCAKNGKRKSA